jgi:hypothetical protein
MFVRWQTLKFLNGKKHHGVTVPELLIALVRMDSLAELRRLVHLAAQAIEQSLPDVLDDKRDLREPATKAVARCMFVRRFLASSKGGFVADKDNVDDEREKGGGSAPQRSSSPGLHSSLSSVFLCDGHGLRSPWPILN